jgi:hypothetical protein
MSSQTIELMCRSRYRYLADRRKQQVRRLKSYLRSAKLKPKLRCSNTYDERCVDDLELCVSRVGSEHRRIRDASDLMLQVVDKKREYAIEYIARRQLVNAKNGVLTRIRKRFFNHRRNFQPAPTVTWVRDLPTRPNLNNHAFFGWNVQKENRTHLHDMYVRAFGVLVQGYDATREQTYSFRVARSLNRLAYCINAIDRGEYNSLNFIFRIYKRQQYDFEAMVSEITSADPLPSPDPAVLCDNFIPFFGRINYFDYNDVTGELADSYDNAMFVFRTELYPFLVAEYVLLRFLLTHTPTAISRSIASKLKEDFENDTVVSNVCQMYPGVFTLLYMLYFERNDRADVRGILSLLGDICSSASNNMECDRVTTRLKLLSNFICDTVYDVEQGNVASLFSDHLMSRLSFFKYNYLVQVPDANEALADINSLPFLVRE